MLSHFEVFCDIHSSCKKKKNKIIIIVIIIIIIIIIIKITKVDLAFALCNNIRVMLQKTLLA